MRKTILILAYTLIQSCASSAQPAANSLLPKVDERLELLSIACKLADVNGFNDSLNPVYSKAVYDHFNPYLNHPFMKMIRELKGRIDTAYWEIPALAAHLGNPPEFKPLVPYNTVADDMWESRELLSLKLVTLLKQFYKDAACEAFFDSQKSYYESIHQQYEKQAVKLNREWIRDFFELKTTENYYAILALIMRDGAYLRVNFEKNQRNTYTIFGCTAFDDKGVPGTFENKYFSRSILHEYIHAFTNQLVDKYSSELQKPAEEILQTPKVWKLMKETFYGNWQYLLYESLVRACTVKYLMANEPDNAEKEMKNQEKAGFFWIRGLVEKLDNYEKNKKTYKNLEVFMPEINTYFKKVAEEMKHGS